MRIRVSTKTVLDRVLKRKLLRKKYSIGEIDLREMLKDILKWANEFVPSEAGSILLDDPTLEKSGKKPGKLYFVACYGKGSGLLTGTYIDKEMGIVGKTYRTGRAYVSKDLKYDPHFYRKIDEQTKYKSKSIICVPIKIKTATIGVLELINRVGEARFDSRDLTLLKIFAGYTSTFIQNSLDAKKFGELSIRDNLTGLYNDRYFFERLSKEIILSIAKKDDLSLIFFDLDRFKEVNDTHGHLAGSQLLREIGTILISAIKNKNIIPVRYGGDEFCIILPGFDMEGASLFAEDLRKTIETHTFLARGVPGTSGAIRIKGLITASLGVSSLRKNVRRGSNSGMREALIKASDTAMYAAKQTGRNKVVAAQGIVSLK